MKLKSFNLFQHVKLRFVIIFNSSLAKTYSNDFVVSVCSLETSVVVSSCVKWFNQTLCILFTGDRFVVEWRDVFLQDQNHCELDPAIILHSILLTSQVSDSIPLIFPFEDLLRVSLPSIGWKELLPCSYDINHVTKDYFVGKKTLCLQDRKVIVKESNKTIHYNF